MKPCVDRLRCGSTLPITRSLHTSFGKPKRISQSTMYPASSRTIGPSVLLASAHAPLPSRLACGRAFEEAKLSVVRDLTLLRASCPLIYARRFLKTTDHSLSSKEGGHEGSVNGRGMDDSATWTKRKRCIAYAFQQRK